MTQLSRTRFVRGNWNAKDIPKRPPWAVVESLFIDLCKGCLQCGECIKACPEEILFVGSAKFPSIDFTKGGCNFCEKCVDACPSGALNSSIAQAWDYKVSMTDVCLSIKGIECRSCGEVCETSAIEFKPKAGGVAELTINQEVCSGCGECVGVCPVNSLSVIIPREKNDER